MNHNILLLTASNLTATAAGVSRFARGVSWHVQVAQILPTHAHFRSIIDFWKPTGCIVACGNLPKPLDATVFGSVPTVFIEADPKHLPRTATVVMSDPVLIGQWAAKELLSTGRGSFAFIGALNDLFWSRSREAAFIRTLRLNGKTCPHRLHPKSQTANEVGLVREITAFVRSLPEGCGIFVAHDFMAEKVLGVCHRLNREVPRDLAVLGVDNNEHICLRTDPPLSSILPNFEQGGYCAASALNDLLSRKAKRTAPHVIRLAPLVLVRRISSSGVSAYGGCALDIMNRIRESEGRLSPARLLSSVSVARRTAELQFRRATGKSILEALHDCRFETACLLLKQRTYSAEDIALRIGYRSAAAFDRFFRSRTGLSPREWLAGNQP